MSIPLPVRICLAKGKAYCAAKPFDCNSKYYLPKALIIHHRKHFDTKLATSLLRNKELLPNEWGWYQVLSAPYKVIHTSVHGFAKEIK